jgi:hypothetical protein
MKIILKDKRRKGKQLESRERILREEELIEVKRISNSVLITYICEDKIYSVQCDQSFYSPIFLGP